MWHVVFTTVYETLQAHVHITLLFMVQGGFSALYVASGRGDTEVVDILLKSGADPNLATMV